MSLMEIQRLLARAMTVRTVRDAFVTGDRAQMVDDGWQQVAGIPGAELERIAFYTLGLRTVTVQRVLPRTWALLPHGFGQSQMERFVAEYPATVDDGLSALSEARRFRDFLLALHRAGEVGSEGAYSARLEYCGLEMLHDPEYWELVASTLPRDRTGQFTGRVRLAPHVRILADASKPRVLFGQSNPKRIRTLCLPTHWVAWLECLPASWPQVEGLGIDSHFLLTAGVLLLEKEDA